MPGDAHVRHNSGNNEWYTPPAILAAARKAFGDEDRPFDLDPATTSEVNEALVHARVYYTKEIDGSTRPWFGNVWLNPPYARPIVSHFVRKVLEREYDGAVVLVNNFTETADGQRLLAACDYVCFLRARVRFWDETLKPASTPLQGQMVLGFGKVPYFARAFRDLGVVLVRAG